MFNLLPPRHISTLPESGQRADIAVCLLCANRVLTHRDAGGLNFFRSIVTFSRGWRPEFALRQPLEFPTVRGFPCRARIPTSRVSS
jgi:hypothetical protein